MQMIEVRRKGCISMPAAELRTAGEQRDKAEYKYVFGIYKNELIMPNSVY